MNEFLQKWSRRKLVQYSAAYLAAAWVLLQVAVLLEGVLQLPDWVDRAALLALAVGFPGAVAAAWTIDRKTPTDIAEEDAAKISAAPANTAKQLGKPIVAVMPFRNISGDADKDFFADGMTEDIITGLSASQKLTVLCRTAIISYQQKHTDIAHLGRNLGAAYLVEGSVRPKGDRIRITVQLSQVENGAQIWAEKYDCLADDIFDIQDEMISKLTSNLGVRLSRAESDRTLNLKPESLSAWELVNRYGVAAGKERVARNAYLKQIEEFTEATKREPNFAPLHAALAYRIAQTFLLGWVEDKAAGIQKIDQEIAIALSLAPEDPQTLSFCSEALSSTLRLEQALELATRAVNNNPCFAHAQLAYGNALFMSGRYEEAEAAFDKAEEFGIKISDGDRLTHRRGYIRIAQQRFEEAIKILESGKAGEYETFLLLLAGCYVQVGNIEQAQKTILRAYELNPKLTKDVVAHLVLVTPEKELGRKMAADTLAIWPDHVGAEA